MGCICDLRCIGVASVTIITTTPFFAELNILHMISLVKSVPFCIWSLSSRTSVSSCTWSLSNHRCFICSFLSNTYNRRNYLSEITVQSARYLLQKQYLLQRIWHQKYYADEDQSHTNWLELNRVHSPFSLLMLLEHLSSTTVQYAIIIQFNTRMWNRKVVDVGMILIQF